MRHHDTRKASVWGGFVVSLENTEPRFHVWNEILPRGKQLVQGTDLRLSPTRWWVWASCLGRGRWRGFSYPAHTPSPCPPKRSSINTLIQSLWAKTSHTYFPQQPHHPEKCTTYLWNATLITSRNGNNGKPSCIAQIKEIHEFEWHNLHWHPSLLLTTIRHWKNPLLSPLLSLGRRFLTWKMRIIFTLCISKDFCKNQGRWKKKSKCEMKYWRYWKHNNVHIHVRCKQRAVAHSMGSWASVPGFKPQLCFQQSQGSRLLALLWHVQVTIVVLPYWAAMRLKSDALTWHKGRAS